ncbi:hypothetical protein [Goodfellowiella coeruleoviolacea]|nr:hypothetical protein [Goodfellowiella coeruleoviolacea]
MGENRVTVEVEPATEPPAGALWNWWMTFSCGDREISAVVSEDLGKMLFEDRAGRFEDEVPVRDVVRYLIGRFVG